MREDIKVYTNQAQSRLSIKTASETKIKACQILNVFGKVVAEPEFQTNNTIDIVALPAGLYVL